MKINTFALRQLLAGEDLYSIAPPAPRGGAFSTNLKSDSDSKTPPLGAGGATLFRPRHKVVILVQELNQTDSELLEKILGAVQLNLQNVEVIEMNQNKGLNLEHIFTQKSANQLISFGVMMSEVNLMLRLTPYQILETKGVKFLSGVSLTDLQNDVPKKKQLWGALKEMF
jgi:DNA polymerase III psi subunit